MSASMRCVRISAVLWTLLFLFPAFALADAKEVHGNRGEAGQWVLVDFTHRPQLAVFHDGERDHLVAVGRPLPGTTIRLDALSADTAVLVLGTPDRQSIRVTLRRGEAFDPEQTLRDFAASLQGGYPAMEPVQEDRHVD